MNVQGDRSRSSFSHFEAQLSCKVRRRLYLCGELGLFTRHTRYNSLIVENMPYPMIESKQMNFELTLTYRL